MPEGVHLEEETDALWRTVLLLSSPFNSTPLSIPPPPLHCHPSSPDPISPTFSLLLPPLLSRCPSLSLTGMSFKTTSWGLLTTDTTIQLDVPLDQLTTPYDATSGDADAAATGAIQQQQAGGGESKSESLVESVGWDKITELEAAVNNEIRKRRIVSAQTQARDVALARANLRAGSKELPAHLTELRLVEIDGIDLIACCGTHVANLGELQMVKVRG